MTRTRTAVVLLVLIVIAAVGVYTRKRNSTSIDAMFTDYFSPDYFTARSRFRQKAEKAGGRLAVLELDAKGPGGENLTIDIAWFGAERPRRVLFHSSGLHGSEGFAGSAIQLQFLEAPPQPPDDGAIVLVHALNPYGMAWQRRVNEENVDLNRNFLGPDEAYAGAPERYQGLDPFLNPPSPPSWDFFYVKVLWLWVWDRDGKTKQAITGGQCEYPKGLFFGGKRLQQGPQRIQTWVGQHLASAEHLVAIDIHTGLGKHGDYKLHADKKNYERLRKTFGKRVIKLDPKGNVYALKGGFRTMFPRALPRTRVDFVSQEFGTYHALRVLHALREENRWHHYGKGGVEHPTKQKLKETFGPDDDSWRQSVLSGGKQLLTKAVELAFAAPPQN
jgi:predicted deacylase